MAIVVVVDRRYPLCYSYSDSCHIGEIDCDVKIVTNWVFIYININTAAGTSNDKDELERGSWETFNMANESKSHQKFHRQCIVLAPNCIK